MKTRTPSRSLVVTLAFGLAACGGGDTTPGEIQKGQAGGGGSRVTLTGAGATFPYPIYSKWFATYGESNPVRVQYGSIGSGGGIRQITEGTVDFGASDAPMKDDEIAKIPDVLHLPTVLGSVVAAYNLPSVKQPLKLSGDVLASVFLGEIRKWNDPRIAQLNPGVALPNRDILVVYRSDGSGTTYVFTDYLSAVSAAFKQRVGVDKNVKWPVGLGAKGNEGVAGQVKQSEGAIGYVELAYANETGLQAAAIRNAAGEFVPPTVQATTAAAAAAAQNLPANSDFRVSIVNPQGQGAYPISSWTFLLVRQNIQDCQKARALIGLVQWALREGGPSAQELHYAPLPESVRDQVLAKLNTITCGPNREPAAAAS